MGNTLERDIVASIPGRIQRETINPECDFVLGSLLSSMRRKSSFLYPHRIFCKICFAP